MIGKEEYIGEERRKDYCPVHHIKCAQQEKTGMEVKKRVPIWVFTIFLICLSSVIGYQLVLLNNHVVESNKIFKVITFGQRELAHNQRIVMHELKLPYEELRIYE
jgi:hypothetical protein